MTPKVFTLRRETCEEAGCSTGRKHHFLRHFFRVGPTEEVFCPKEFTRITGLSIPIGGSLRVKLVVVQTKRKQR